ncbi:MAG TPA: IS110 family transposase [Longimicrobiaceae bacterium]|nr:IS110 family transposase [Longimicrobiaceae bacterium]
MSEKVWLGIDAHQEQLVIAVLVGMEEKPREEVRVANEPKKLRRFVERWSVQGEIRACYEASGGGYVLQRWMQSWGYSCEVIAPSLIPQRAGHRRKHDRYDARELARHLRSGELVRVRIPSEAEERVRDVVRCRERFQKEILMSRHEVTKFLARRGRVYREGSRWTKKHWAWLRTVLKEMESVEDRLVLQEYMGLLEYKIARREELDRVIEEVALRPAYTEAVGRLRCFRGIQTHGAMVLSSEVGDFRRFDSAEKLSSYLGLVPSEDSSGARQRRGAITKAGNAHCRHVLIQAAWAYQYPPACSDVLKRRQAGQPADVVAHAWKAQHRLHKLYRKLSLRRGHGVAVVAVARELTGFLWAVMREIEPPHAAEASPIAQAA